MPRIVLHLLLSLLLLISQQSGIAEVMAHPDLQFASHSNSCTQFEQDFSRELPVMLAADRDQFEDSEHLNIGFISKNFGILILLSPDDFKLVSTAFTYVSPTPQGYQSRAPPLAS